MYRVIIAGDRHWDDLDLEYRLRLLLSKMPPNVEIVHGACQGVDLVADRVARAMGFQVTAFPADWKRYGPPAGPIRNREMLDYICQRTPGVYLFHRQIESSRGTRDMMNQAKVRQVPFLVIQ